MVEQHKFTLWARAISEEDTLKQTPRNGKKITHKWEGGRASVVDLTAQLKRVSFFLSFFRCCLSLVLFLWLFIQKGLNSSVYVLPGHATRFVVFKGNALTFFFSLEKVEKTDFKTEGRGKKMNVEPRLWRGDITNKEGVIVVLAFCVLTWYSV